jgi:hypothetical protein
MRTEPDAPRGFGGLASLISVLPGPSAAPRLTTSSTRSHAPSPLEHSGSPTDADLTARSSEKSSWTVNRTVVAFGAVVAFGLAFVATVMILADQSSKRPLHEVSGRTTASDANAGPPGK